MGKRIAALIQVIVAAVLGFAAGVILIKLGSMLAGSYIWYDDVVFVHSVLAIYLFAKGGILYTKGLAGLRQAKPVAKIQVIVAAVLSLAAGIILINLGFVQGQPGVVSLRFSMFLHLLLAICLLAQGRVLFMKGLAGLRQAKPVADSDSTD